MLYTVDTTGDRVLQVNPDGTTILFANLPAAPHPGGGKCVLPAPDSFGGGFLVSTYNIMETDPDIGAILSISADGTAVTQLTDGLNGAELLTFGPGGPFGTDLFVPTTGGAATADGFVFTMSSDGTLTLFMSNLDAVSVAFDTQGILGGGMFVSDINDNLGAGKIWRVTPRQ